jgi:hypothetical protein
MAISLVTTALVAALVSACLPQTLLPPPPTTTLPTGPYAYSQTTVPAGNGFGGGTISYPSDGTGGPFGAVAVVSGQTGTQADVAWYGPTLASNDFVVFTIDTNATTDLSTDRADQLLAALSYLTTSSPVATEVDATRLAVMGWSMGGGGALEAAARTPSLKAVVALAPYDSISDWSAVQSPTLIVGCQADTSAPVDTYAKPFYAGLSVDKAYLEIAGGIHVCPAMANIDIAGALVPWLKRYVNGDTTYPCPALEVSSTVSDYQSSCAP